MIRYFCICLVDTRLVILVIFLFYTHLLRSLHVRMLPKYKIYIIFNNMHYIMNSSTLAPFLLINLCTISIWTENHSALVERTYLVVSTHLYAHEINYSPPYTNTYYMPCLCLCWIWYYWNRGQLQLQTPLNLISFDIILML